MSDAARNLARTLLELGPRTGSDLVMGRVLSTVPLRVLAEGNAQDGDSLLRADGIDPDGLRAGDKLALWPIEERQRYVILTKVVEL